jgi:hypothetical protein
MREGGVDELSPFLWDRQKGQGFGEFGSLLSTTTKPSLAFFNPTIRTQSVSWAGPPWGGTRLI